MVVLGLLLLILWQVLRRRRGSLPPRSAPLLIGILVAASVGVVFVGYGAGFPLRPDGLDAVDGDSPADDFAEAYLFPSGFLALITPAFGPSLPVVSVAAGLAAASARGDRRPLTISAWLAMLLLALPYPIAAGLSGEGPGPRGIGSIQPEPLPTGATAARDFSPLPA